MNILVTLDKNYIYQLKVLLNSIILSNIDDKFNVYIIHRTLVKEDLLDLEKYIDINKINVIPIHINEDNFKEFPVVEKRYPIEIYFRLFAAKYLPKDVDRILYLDPDIVVINSLKSLYNMDFEENLFIATTHTKKIVKKINDVRLNLNKDIPYVNTGVLMINIEKLRKIDVAQDINLFFKTNKTKLMLPDQDILSALYGNKTKIVDSLIYNLGERTLNLYNVENIKNKKDIDWVRKNTVIVHYFGRNKPWHKNYIGKLRVFYDNVEKNMNYRYNNIITTK